MRKYTVVFVPLLIAAGTPASAGEAFVSQIGGARQFAGNFRSTLGEAVSAAKIAAPIKVNAFPATIPTTLPPNASASSVTQIGNNNYAMVAQTGGNNLSAIAQQGSGNQAIVNQRR
jgi:Curlin associated repeat